MFLQPRMIMMFQEQHWHPISDTPKTSAGLKVTSRLRDFMLVLHYQWPLSVTRSYLLHWSCENIDQSNFKDGDCDSRKNALAAFRKWRSDLVCFRVHVATMFPRIHAALQTLKTNVFSEKTIRLVSGKPQRMCFSVNALFQEVKVLPEQQHNDGFTRQVFIGSTEQTEILCDLQRPASRVDIMVKFTAWHGLDLCECAFTFVSDQIQITDVRELHV